MLRIKIIMQLKSIKFNAACISRISIFSRTICTRNERQRKKANEPLPAATHCRDAEMESCGELQSYSGVQWVSSVTRAHWQDAQAQEPVACCLLPLLQLMLHFEAGIESRLQRTNFGFICNFTLAERERREGSGKESQGDSDLAVSLAINH